MYKKRKLDPSSSLLARKKIKRSLHQEVPAYGQGKADPKDFSATIAASVDDLPWTTVDVGQLRDDVSSMPMLEEAEGVEVIYENGVDGNVVGFQVKVPQPAAEPTTSNTKIVKVPQATPIYIDHFDAVLLPAWAPYPLHPALLESIHHRGFETPTEIQRRSLEVIFRKPSLHNDPYEDTLRQLAENEEQGFEVKQRDIIGIAETGSGKTLAYGLPILQHILTSLSTFPPSAPSETTHRRIIVTPPAATSRRSLKALVLAPTRELALQVSDHLNACLDQLFAAQSHGRTEETLGSRAPPPVSVAAIVGGMSAQKQRRILSRGADVLVATPGRLWDLCGEDATLAAELKELQFLVLDEADRMVEAGHFHELDNILRITSRPPPGMINKDAIPAQVRPEDLAYTDAEDQKANDALQTFIFSATMSKDLQRDLKRRHNSRKKKGTDSTTLEDLLMKLDFRDPDPVIIDLSPEGGHVKGLQESKVECLMTDKDVYLYYFLLRHPGRSLVFLSSIDGIRRLMPVLQLLKLNVWPLHSGLQQKQRLKNLDRFKSSPNAALLATDVAARGLDVPAVDHVIHYQVPRTADAFVHRNGRTARAMSKGFGLVLCAPEERRVFRGILSGLGRDESDIPELIVEHHFVDKLKTRVQLARKIDGLAHRSQKEKHDRNWIRQNAEAMDMALPSDLESDASADAPLPSKTKFADQKVAALKMELKQALDQPLIARDISTRYITSGSGIADDILRGENHEVLLGLKRMGAGSEVVRKKTKRKKML